MWVVLMSIAWLENDAFPRKSVFCMSMANQNFIFKFMDGQVGNYIIMRLEQDFLLTTSGILI